MVGLLLSVGTAFGAECDSVCQLDVFKQTIPLDSAAKFASENNEIKRADSLFRKSLAIQEARLGLQSPFVAVGYYNLAFVVAAAGKYTAADTLYQKAMAIAKGVSSMNQEVMINILHKWATNLMILGRYDEADSAYQWALRLTESKYGPDFPASVFLLLGSAMVLDVQGKYSQEQAILHRSLGIVDRSFGHDSPMAAMVLTAMAMSFHSSGQNGDAESAYREALRIDEQVLGSDHSMVGTIWTGLGAMLHSEGRNAEAEVCYRRAIAIQEKIYSPNHPQLSVLYAGLATCIRDSSNGSEKEKLILLSLAIQEKAFGSDYPMNIVNLVNLAAIQFYSGKFQEAKKSLLKASRISSTAPSELRWKLHSNCLSFYEQSEPDLAIFNGKLAINILQNIRGNLKGDSIAGKSFLESVRPVYAKMVDLLASQGRLLEAQEVLALLKSQETHQFLRGEKVDTSGLLQVDLDSLEFAWSDSLRLAEQSLAKVKEKNSATVSKSGGQDLRFGFGKDSVQQKWNIASGERKFDTTIAHLEVAFHRSSKNSSRRILTHGESAHIHERQVAGLDSGTILLQYLLLDSIGQVLVTNRSNVSGHRLKVGSKQLNRMVADFAQTLRDPHQDPRPLGRKLYDQLIAPVAADLDSAKAGTVMFSLDGALRYIPMAALYDGQKYLVERYALSVYTEGSQETVAEKPLASWSVAGLGNSRAAPGFDSLPAVRDELHGIVRETAGGKGVLPGIVRLDDAFTKTSFQTALSQRYPVVHLASHFKFSPFGEYDSYLLLGDSSRLDLHELRTGPYSFSGVDLLTLSACQTAMIGNRNANGIEIDGMAGIAQSRGAKAVMATLWPVHDASTQSFMQEFYRGHEAGLTKAAALRKAQLAFLQGGGSAKSGSDGLFIPPKGAPYAHPYYWAPFILMGNWL